MVPHLLVSGGIDGKDSNLLVILRSICWLGLRNLDALTRELSLEWLLKMELVNLDCLVRMGTFDLLLSLVGLMARWPFAMVNLVSVLLLK